jgi:hypothetical protein
MQLNADRKLWEHPWKYTESFIIAMEILLTGVIVEIVSGGKGVIIPAFPFNALLILCYLSILLFIRLKYGGLPVVEWLSGIPAAISSISMYALLILLLGFIPQNIQESSNFFDLLGISHIKNSWPFLFVQCYFLIVLGMVILRRAIPFKKRNIGFLMNHFGLWLTLVAAGMGSADLKRLTINLLEDGKENNVAVSSQGEMYKVPFTLKLLDFDVVQYPPKLAIVNVETGKYLMGNVKSFPFAEKNLETEISDWHINVVDFIPQAMFFGNTIQASDSVGSNPAAYIFARNNVTGDTVRGWVSSGSYSIHPSYLLLKAPDVLILTLPEPKKFSSKLIVYKDTLKADTVTIEVNKPYSVNGWKIYQQGYDENKGKWSTLSVLEVVNDPWLPIVYVGIVLLFMGALYLFWIGKNKKQI